MECVQYVVYMHGMCTVCGVHAWNVYVPEYLVTASVLSVLYKSCIVIAVVTAPHTQSIHHCHGYAQCHLCVQDEEGGWKGDCREGLGLWTGEIESLLSANWNPIIFRVQNSSPSMYCVNGTIVICSFCIDLQMLILTIVAHCAVCPWCIWHCFSPWVPRWLLFHGFHMAYPFPTVWSLPQSTSLFVASLEICLCMLIMFKSTRNTYSHVPRAKPRMCLCVCVSVWQVYSNVRMCDIHRCESTVLIVMEWKVTDTENYFHLWFAVSVGSHLCKFIDFSLYWLSK